jgi:prepilin-type processing-associated H-X9-DG protein
VGGSDGTVRKGVELIRDARGTYLIIRENWGSAHQGGVQFLFADGSVRTLNYGTSPMVVQVLRTPDGGEPTPAE